MGSAVGTGAERPEGYRVVVLVAGGPDGPRPRVHPAGEPLLLADDLAAVRGDGCFETLLLVNGRVAKPERHLARLARSSSALGITGGPTAEEWRAGIALAAREWGPGSEAMLRLVLSRGPERGGAETAYITVAPVGPHAVRARAEGIAVTALNRGFPADFAATAPWMLLGSKTLSYAANMAALRHAAANGFDDVVYLSAEGEVLEGPRSTLVIARSGELVSPPVEVGILEGTTLAALAEVAKGQGIAVRRERLLMTDLLAADAVWLLSSVTLAARVRRIDAVTLPEADPGIAVAGMVDRAVGRA
ncbi:aminodeoxychorismate lyase [Rhodococcus sp. IEGM 1408]|uniref:aminodeoxychorismate lyase n=1 Tax=Rhodococcus sp. IEGM 1408 TaxID=3082220 RepID=UPI00295442E6|nr:aminodeoxychorismate lyase [Rhodococcus sp. IEGM 1408]MDV8002408.1 aminodeoxychorismate lyase [Rhodococcus sp. IEGM 1408]